MGPQHSRQTEDEGTCAFTQPHLHCIRIGALPATFVPFFSHNPLCPGLKTEEQAREKTIGWKSSQWESLLLAGVLPCIGIALGPEALRGPLVFSRMSSIGTGVSWLFLDVIV